jgi:hypothetical protein
MFPDDLTDEEKARVAVSVAAALNHQRMVAWKRSAATLGSDTTAPTVQITSTESSPTAVVPIPITITFSESVTGFTSGDLTVVGASISDFAGSGTTYTANLYPTPNASVTVNIAQGVAIDAAGNGNTAATQFAITSNTYTLADEYTDTVAAGSVHGTTATPTGQTRTATDADGNKLSIGSGVVNLLAMKTANTDPRLHYPSVARLAGRTLFYKVTLTTGVYRIGLGGNNTGSPSQHSFVFTTGGNLQAMAGTVGPLVATVSAGVEYQIAITMRTAGCFYFIKGGAFTDWLLMWVDAAETSTPLYPGMGYGNVSGVAAVDSMRIPTGVISIAPIASDAFTRADGALGTTGGGGAAEAGGTGLTWTSRLGTWGVATNKAASSALDGGTSVSIATVPCGTANVVAEVIANRSAGTAGLCLRYTDANNYIKVVHNGTNLQVIEVVAGTPNTLVNAAATYDPTYRTVVLLNGTKLRAIYRRDMIGTEVTTAVTTGNNHGIFTDDTGATFDNFVIWARGVEGQHATALNSFLV